MGAKYLADGGDVSNTLKIDLQWLSIRISIRNLYALGG